MRISKFSICLAGMITALCGWLGSDALAAGDVLLMKNGTRLEGNVLKESDEHYFLDLGFDVLRIPRDSVSSRQKSTEALSSGGKKIEPKKKDDIYATATLIPKTVKELAAEFGEGVVLVQTPGGLGSGFIINDRGYCVTNYHVIERETKIAVTIFARSGNEFQRRRVDNVQIIALNPFFDLALLQIPVQKDLKFKPVYLVKDDDHKEGDEVFAIGNPLGLDRSVSRGIVSTRNRNFEGVVYIQTTTQINPGNSGGPLFNNRGEVVGVTNMKLLLGEGLGFAIPITYVKHFLNNRDAFAFDKNNPNAGYRYLEAPRRKRAGAPPKS